MTPVLAIQALGLNTVDPGPMPAPHAAQVMLGVISEHSWGQPEPIIMTIARQVMWQGDGAR